MSENNLIQFLNQYSISVHLPSINKNVEIKPITTGQLKKILSYEGIDDTFIIEDILDDIINGCVITKDFNIRKITKGNEYTFNIRCPKCNTDLINNINIDELENVPYPTNIDNKVILTDTLSTYVTFITRGMQKQAVSIVKKNKRYNEEQKIAEMATYVFAMGMTKFDTPAGEITNSSIEDKKELLDSLSENVYDIINKWYEKYDYGIKFKYKPKCRFCNWEEDEQEIPLSGFFF